MTNRKSAQSLATALTARFGEAPPVDETITGLDTLSRLAARSVRRRYAERAVDRDLLRLLCACALSAPSKSDLQQADILIADKTDQDAIADLIPDQPFIRGAPAFLVFLASGRRLPEIARMRGKPFPNDHLDQFFNAAVDAGIVLATFINAADAAGLGTCPISAIRDHSARISDMLRLPQRVIPVAGLCVGWPADEGRISPRLPLACTVHEGRYDEGDLAARIDAYDRRRAAVHGYKPRDPARWGDVGFYGWSEDKARQYGVPQRPDFGAFVRKKGFRLD
ncbi:MAG TPA: nitroreductase family protein [Xanthobacteraceae bacterium]|jgi:nitroreductase/FMN reductase [NAD(P)H]|nr:nitroreductase family protein [Xanthobacteraceae bacterium]